MVNLDYIATNFDEYGILCKDLEQARALWDAVHEKWPSMVSNWKLVGPPENPKEFTNRVFLLVCYGSDRRLVHSSLESNSYRTIVPFEVLCVPELPPIEMGEMSILTLFEV